MTFGIIYYHGYDELRKTLNDLNLKFTEKDVISEFWGKEFLVQKPTGKGATTKIQKLHDLGFHKRK